MAEKVTMCLLLLNSLLTASHFDGFLVLGQLKGTIYKLLQPEAQQVFLLPKTSAY